MKSIKFSGLSSLRYGKRTTRLVLSDDRLVSRNAFDHIQKRQQVAASSLGPEKFGWKEPARKCMPGEDNVEEVPIADIKRPLQGTRSNNSEKVEALMESISDVGLLQPIDILLVEGKYYGFSGCHRYEACQKLGHEKILAKVRKANRQTLQMHFR